MLYGVSVLYSVAILHSVAILYSVSILYSVAMLCSVSLLMSIQFLYSVAVLYSVFCSETTGVQLSRYMDTCQKFTIYNGYCGKLIAFKYLKVIISTLSFGLDGL